MIDLEYFSDNFSHAYDLAQIKKMGPWVKRYTLIFFVLLNISIIIYINYFDQSVNV